MHELLGPLSYYSGQSPLHAVRAYGESGGLGILLIEVVQDLTARAIEFHIGERILDTPRTLHKVAPAANSLNLDAPAAKLCRDYDFDEFNERETEGSP